MKKVGVLLSGCGVYDGSEIHESVLTLLSLSQNNLEYVCIAPDILQKHVVNHTDGQEISESRNVLIESSRISRGKIISLSDLNFSDISSLVLTGGFGAAKNLCSWAFEGKDCSVNPILKELILDCVNNKKPIVSLCVSPTIIAKSLQDYIKKPILTFGHEDEQSEYSIIDFHQSVQSLGFKTQNKSVSEVCVDKDFKIITAPCYMMEASIDQVYENIKLAIDKLSAFLYSKD